MIKWLMNRYAVSETGAKNLVKGSLIAGLANITIMMSMGVLYLFVVDLLSPITKLPRNFSNQTYLLLSLLAMFLYFLVYKLQYNATFLAGYQESSDKRVSIAEKLRLLPLSFFGKRDLSDLTTTIMKDCESLETAFTHFIPELFGSIISITIVGIWMLFYFGLSLTFATLWCVIAAFLLVLIGRKKMTNIKAQEKKVKLDCEAGIQEFLEVMPDLKSLNKEKKYMQELKQKVDNVEKYAWKSEFKMASFVVTAQLLLKFGIITVILFGGNQYLANTINIFDFIMCIILVSRLYSPLSVALENLAAIMATDTSITRMKDLENYKTQTGSKEFNVTSYDITLDKVKFAYSEDNSVLKEISFVAKQGDVTAIIGPSGEGKTTIAKLIARFYDLDSGTIKIGDKDISKIDPETLLKAFSMVFQDVVLFNESVRDNIRVGRLTATEEEIYEAAKAANCLEFINRLPKGFDTILNENAAILSGGERQRLSIARALLKDAPIILLDEATASLDAENETKIQEAITKLIANKTVIIIAHRMRTVLNANKIIVLKNDRVVESGDPQILSKKSGIFSSMLAKQNASETWTI